MINFVRFINKKEIFKFQNLIKKIGVIKTYI